MDNAQFYTPDVVCVLQPTKHFSEVRDPDRLHQRLFNLNHRGADVKRNPGRPVTCNAWARAERCMLRRALGVSLLTVLQGQMESPFLNLDVDGDQEKRHESLSVAGCGA